MKIGIDFRFFKKDDLYSLFLLTVLRIFSLNNKFKIVIYLNTEADKEFFDFSCELKIVKEKQGNIIDDFLISSKYKKEKFDMMIFFNEYKPILYKKNYIIVIQDLQKVLYGAFKSTIAKHYYLKLIEQNLKSSKKVICFNKQILSDINERFNVEESKISVINGFFGFDDFNLSKELKKQLNIKEKYKIEGDYLIYDLSNSEVKNLEKIFLALKNLKDEGKILKLFVLGEKNSENIEFRKVVLDYKISDLVFFVGDVEIEYLQFYYKQSLGVVYPNIYDAFPFGLNNAVIYNIPILTSDSITMRDLFGDKIEYFNILSNTDTYKSLINFTSNNKKNINYSDIIAIDSDKEYVKKLEKVIGELLLN
ncbi:MAG: glycosyltransferase [Candidatus Gracilibacteria bacterium]|nr:glycosyltransferase [Candidatus Gracilibacteria bacterium]